MDNLFVSTLKNKNTSRPPVWMMRQAGRYHSHYQNLKKKYSFMELCKTPELACEVTMGPIREFDFDAAILFSDLLFPLEVMGMGLRYDPGPKLDWHLKSTDDLKKLVSGEKLLPQLQFQADALKLIRKELPKEKGLIGFVGGPLTLFCYAVEGSHAGDLASSRQGIHDGRFTGFVDRLMALLCANMVLQAKAGADVVAVFDTCAGEFDPVVYREAVVPVLKTLFENFKRVCPETSLIYYSKGTSPAHWNSLRGLPFDCLGVDWRQDLTEVLREYSGTWAIQGNIDPDWLLLSEQEMEKKVRAVFEKVSRLPQELKKGWVCGLGHGVLQTTPEANVKKFVKLVKEVF